MRLATSISHGEPFSGRCDLGMLGDVRLCRIEAFAHKEGQRSTVPRSARNPSYKLVFQKRGTSHLEQRDKRTIIGAASWYVYDVEQPYSLANVEALDQVAVVVPKDMCSDYIDTLVRKAPQQAMPVTGISRILYDCIHSTLSQFDQVGEENGNSLGDSLLELAKLTIVESLGGLGQASARDVVRERIESYVLHNLFDHDLNLDSIAASMNCSKRYLHKVFHADGRTLSQFIWDCRLDRCRRDLENPGLLAKSITEIAFAWGFNNSSHFSRAFRRKFGLSPRDYRHRQLAGLCDLGQ